MIFPVLIETSNGQFTASLVGAPDVRVVEATRTQAIAELKEELRQRIELGELLTLEVDVAGVSDLAGKYSDDPTLREICTQAYEMRDADHAL